MPHTMSWAVILAGGDGRRLRPLTRSLTGDERPKQYCRLFGTSSLLAETRARVAQNIPAARTLFTVATAHKEFYEPELAGVSPWQIVAQPANRGTLAAVAYSLIRLRTLGADGVVGFFPSDHYYRDPLTLATTVKAAYAQAQRAPDSIVLLGAEATRPETEYGWIEPGDKVVQRRRPMARAALVRTVRRFHEKPQIDLAVELLSRRCLWNTLVVIGTIAAFESLLAAAAPDLWRLFPGIALAQTTDEERATAQAVYQAVASSDFSRDALAAFPDRLSVMTLPDIGWTDLGHPVRVADVLAERDEVLSGPRLAG